MSYIFPHNVYKLKGFLDSPELLGPADKPAGLDGITPLLFLRRGGLQAGVVG